MGTPRLDVQLLFNEIAISIDGDQYRDIVSLVDMYHVYLRKYQVSYFFSFNVDGYDVYFQIQYRKYRPSEINFTVNPAKSRLIFAGTAILEGVRERNRKWTWNFFAERRNSRKDYVTLIQRKLLNKLLALVTCRLILTLIA